MESRGSSASVPRLYSCDSAAAFWAWGPSVPAPEMMLMFAAWPPNVRFIFTPPCNMHATHYECTGSSALKKDTIFFDLTWDPALSGLYRPSLATEMMLIFSAWPINVSSGLYLHLHVVCVKLTIKIQGVLHQKQDTILLRFYLGKPHLFGPASALPTEMMLMFAVWPHNVRSGLYPPPPLPCHMHEFSSLS